MLRVAKIFFCGLAGKHHIELAESESWVNKFRCYIHVSQYIYIYVVQSKVLSVTTRVVYLCPWCPYICLVWGLKEYDHHQTLTVTVAPLLLLHQQHALRNWSSVLMVDPECVLCRLYAICFTYSTLRIESVIQWYRVTWLPGMGVMFAITQYGHMLINN